MNFDRIRRQKIDKNYIDDAFKELPLFESMAVSSDKESYRFATELLGMEHVHSTPTMRNNKDDHHPNSSSATLKSMYLDEGISEYIDSSARVNTDHYGHDVHPGKYSFREKDATQFSSIKNIESNTLPQILRSKPLESPGKIRSDKPLKGDQDEAVRESYAREEAWRITENSPPSWNDLNEFKGMFSDVKRIIMKALLLDIQKKENDYYVINQLNAEKIGKIFAKKIFLMFESQEEVLDTKHTRYNENYNLIRSRVNGYFDSISQGDETQDKKPLLHVFLVYQKGKVWEYSKIKIEGTRNTGVYFWTSVYNPVSMLKVSRNDMLDNYAEILLKSLVLKQPVLKKSGIGKTGLDKDTTARNSVCSVWDSGVEVYKKIAKSYAELSQEKISRDQMYFLLLERYHDSQVGV